MSSSDDFATQQVDQFAGRWHQDEQRSLWKVSTACSASEPPCMNTNVLTVVGYGQRLYSQPHSGGVFFIHKSWGSQVHPRMENCRRQRWAEGPGTSQRHRQIRQLAPQLPEVEFCISYGMTFSYLVLQGLTHEETLGMLSAMKIVYGQYGNSMGRNEPSFIASLPICKS